MPQVTVHGVPEWVSASRLLGPGDWAAAGEVWSAELSGAAAADLAARLRGVGLGGALLQVEIRPPLKRREVRAARTQDARRRRDTTPGFTKGDARLLDAEGKRSLTPEALAKAIGRRVRGQRVIDATCGAGGNAIGFARAGCQVTAIEPDPARLRDARHNARVYRVLPRLVFIQGRAQELLAGLEAEVLFVDPPWGGDWDRASTGLTDLPVLEAILSAAGDRYPQVMLKLPPSFNPASLPGYRYEAWFGHARGDKHRVKFILATSLPAA